MTSLPIHTPSPFTASLPDGIANLADSGDWSLLHVHGADATRFLHSQLTQDFALARPGQARLAAYCSPKGRMLVSFIAWPASATGGDWLLLCRADLAESTIKRLRMFVLRSKVTIEDISSQYALFGASGTAAVALWREGVSDAEDPAVALDDCTTAWQHRSYALPALPSSADAAATAIAAGADAAAGAADDMAAGAQRHLVTLYPAVWAGQRLPLLLCVQPRGLPAPAHGAALAVQDWRWLPISSGVAHITQASSDLFVPQMLNYESVDGVHFKKGCYPGQEVVARSQFRGAIKRRACIATVGLPVVGMDGAAGVAGVEGHGVADLAGAAVTATSATSATSAAGADADTAPSAALAGREVWLCRDGAEPEPVGYVADAAPLPPSAYPAAHSAAHSAPTSATGQPPSCILSAALQTAAQAAVQQGEASLRLGTPEGAVMQLHPLPYALREDI